MTKKQKLLLLLLVFVIILYAASGFITRPDVYIVDFEVSPDGQSMTIRAGVASSMGYIRDIHIETEGSVMKIEFYKTFGGANSSYGAKNEFTFELTDGIDEIRIYRGESGYETALVKDSAGQWQKP